MYCRFPVLCPEVFFSFFFCNTNSIRRPVLLSCLPSPLVRVCSLPGPSKGAPCSLRGGLIPLPMISVHLEFIAYDISFGRSCFSMFVQCRVCRGSGQISTALAYTVAKLGRVLSAMTIYVERYPPSNCPSILDHLLLVHFGPHPL